LAEVSFGEWLKRQRKAEGWTQEQLAQQVSCSTITLRKIEAEERRPSAQIVERLAEIFNIPQNEQASFLRFARGDWKSAPVMESKDAPWRVSTTSPRSNLPASLTSLIGRDQEITKLSEYLSNPSIRLVTLIGPPGIGKTRLSAEVASGALHDFPDGAFFVALAPLEDSSLVASIIVQTLGFAETELKSPLERLKEGIGDKHMLLVLDNLEHIIEGAASLVSDLLLTCPRLKILTTSREALRVPGEWLYSVPTLDVPKEGSSIDMETASKFPALTLFAERARAVHSNFALNADNIQPVAIICTQLDGLPLAIELIAARIRLMSPQSLLAHLNDQFTLYADGMRAVPPRQKTLHNAISWSYNLLSPEEQNLFVRLSVFSGGFTLDAVEAIFSRIVTDKSVADLIALLLDKNLLQRTLDDHGESRFNMLVTIQQFALDHLRSIDIEGKTRDGHLAYFLNFAEKADKEIHGPDQAKWLDRLEIEFDNFRTALDWCITNQKTEIALCLLGALCWAWDVRSHYVEARNWFDKVRTLPEIGTYPAQYGALLNHIARHCWMLGDFREGSVLLEESQKIWVTLGADGEQGLAESLCWLGAIAFWGESDKSTAQSYFEQSLRISQKHRDRYGSAVSMLYLGRINYSSESAQGMFEKSLDLFRQLGDLYHIAIILLHLGWKSRDQGNFQKARLCYTQRLMIDEELKFKEGIAETLLHMGDLSIHEGDYDQAEQFLQKSLLVSREYGLKLDERFAYHQLGILSLHRKDYRLAARYFKEDYRLSHGTSEKMTSFDLLYGLAAVSAGLNQPERAARLYGATQTIFEKSPYMPLDRAEFEKHIQIAREQLGDTRFETLASEGRAMTMERAIAYALENQEC
jgi:predicted ATPase/transcriptional regulator with XRE-family HTH domain/Tfp pilus assembly protein PilF